MWGKKYRFGRKKAIYLSSTTTMPCSLFTAYADIDLAVRGMKEGLIYLGVHYKNYYKVGHPNTTEHTWTSP